MKPTISILDKRFSYTNSARTDLRQTFERIRKAARQEPVPKHEPDISERTRADSYAGPAVSAPIQIRRIARERG